MAISQSNVTLEDPNSPALATSASARHASNSDVDPADAARTPVLNKLAAVESPSTSSDLTGLVSANPSLTGTTSTVLTAIGSPSIRIPAVSPGDLPTPSDKLTTTTPPVADMENHSNTTNQAPLPTGVSSISSTPPATSEPPTTSVNTPSAETPTPTWTAESSNTSHNSPSPKSTWDRPSSTFAWTTDTAETTATSWSDSWPSPPAEISTSSWTSDWTESSSSWAPPISSTTNVSLGSCCMSFADRLADHDIRSRVKSTFDDDRTKCSD